MLRLKRKFKQSKDFNFSNYIPVVHIFNNTGMKDIPTNEFGFVNKENIDAYLLEQESNGNFLGFSNVNLKSSVANYVPNLDYVSNYTEECDFIDNRHKIQNLTLNFNNAEKDLFRMSDLGNLESKLIRVYYILPDLNRANREEIGIINDDNESVMYFFQGVCMRYDISTDMCSIILEDLSTFVLEEYEIPANRVPDTEIYLEQARLEPYPMIYGYHKYAPTLNVSSLNSDEISDITSDMVDRLYSLSIAFEAPDIAITELFHNNVYFPATATNILGTNTSEAKHRALGSKYGFLYMYDDLGEGTTNMEDVVSGLNYIDFRYLRIPYTSAFFDNEQIYGYEMAVPDDIHNWPIFPNPENPNKNMITISSAHNSNATDENKDFYLNPISYGVIEVEREIPPLTSYFTVFNYNQQDFPSGGQQNYINNYFNQTTLPYGPEPSFAGALDIGVNSGLFQAKVHKIVHPVSPQNVFGWGLTHTIDRTNTTLENEGTSQKGEDWWKGGRCITTARIEGVFLGDDSSRSDPRWSYSQYSPDNGLYSVSNSNFNDVENEGGLIQGSDANDYIYYINTIKESSLNASVNLRDWLVYEGYISGQLDGSGDWDSSWPFQDDDEYGHLFRFRVPNLRWENSQAHNSVSIARAHFFDTVDSTQGCALNYFGIYQRMLFDVSDASKFGAHLLGRSYLGSGVEEYVDEFEYSQGVDTAITNPVDIILDIMYREVGIKGAINEEKYLEVRSFYDGIPTSSIQEHLGNQYISEYADRVRANTFDTLFQARIGLSKLENTMSVLKGICEDFGFVFRFNQRNELVIDRIREYAPEEIITLQAKDVGKLNYKRTKIEDVYKDLVIKYDYDAYSDRYRRQFPRDNGIDEDYVSADYYCQEVFGTVYDPEYYKKDETNVKEKELKYVGDFVTATLLHAYHLSFNMNQKLILTFDLPLSYFYIEVGDVISFDKLVGGITPYGIDYTIPNIINGQLMFPYFIVTKTTKTKNKVSITCMQVPQNFISDSNQTFVNTIMEKYPNMFYDRLPSTPRQESKELGFGEVLTARWLDTGSILQSVYSNELVTFEVVSKTPYNYEIKNEEGEVANYEEVNVDITDTYRYHITLKQSNVLFNSNEHKNSVSKIIITNNSGDKKTLLIMSRPTISEIYNKESFSKFYPTVNRNVDNFIKFIDNYCTKNINGTLNKNILDMYDLNKDGIVDIKDISEYSRSLYNSQDSAIATKAFFNFDRGQAFVDTNGIPSVMMIMYKGKIKITKTCNDNWLFRVYKNVIIISPIGKVEVPTSLFNYVGNVKFTKFQCTNYNSELIDTGFSVNVEQQLGLIREDYSDISSKAEIIDQQVTTHPHPNPTKERIKKSFVENEVNVQTNNFIGKSTHSSAQKIDRIYELNQFTRSGDGY